MFGESAETKKLLRLVDKMAKAEAPVLITGETGAGKEVIARRLHEKSSRKNKIFVAVNCGAFPDQLIQSELFGHEKGPFTGAYKQTIGKVEHADGGTLFLDEIGDLPINQQANLLRFLQEKEIVRIGGHIPIAVDVRIIAATHVDLKQAIAQKYFREDLFHRINVLGVHVTSLHERPDDIEVLAKYFADEFYKKNSKPLKAFSAEAIGLLKSYPWPGNVRELSNRINRALVMAEGAEIQPEDLDLERRNIRPAIQTLKVAREETEKSVILYTLRWANQKIPETARLLGITRATLYRLMDKHSIDIYTNRTKK
jgi:DNA-binding NtrC family response regulator